MISSLAYAQECITPTDGMVITSDTTFCPGTYSLPSGVTIGNNSIILDCNGAMLKGNSIGNGISISNSYVTVNNCVISNFTRGINLYYFQSSTLTNNNITSNQHGIYINSMYNNNITNNNINSNVNGITIYGSRHNTITNNNINSNQDGIYLASNSWYNNVTENTFKENTQYGLNMNCAWSGSAGMVICSEQNSAWKNKFYDSGINLVYATAYGRTNYFCTGVGNYYADSVPINHVPLIDCSPTPDSDVYTDQTNPTSFEWDASATYSSIQEGIYNTNINRATKIVEGTGPYLENVQTVRDYVTLDCQGEALQGNDTGYGIYLDNINITVNNCVISNFSRGIYVHSYGNNILSTNKIISNEYGVYLYWDYSTYYNTIANNNVSLNQYGIYLGRGSRNNTIMNNGVSSNEYGTYLSGGCGAPRYNKIIENTFKENTNYGLYLSCVWCGSAGVTMCSDGNNIYHSNFIDNYIQAQDSGTDYWGPRDMFDNSYPLDFDPLLHGGNYWSDYTGVDLYSGPDQNESGSDGIGDSPYTFNYNEDRYPLMQPWKNYVTPPETCSDNIKNQDETDVDCSGSCSSCEDDKTCIGNADCLSGYCYEGVCTLLSKFLTLPFRDSDIRIQVGWNYADGTNHKGIDYIKGEVGDSEDIVHSWQEFKVLSVAEGEVKYFPSGSEDWGNYVLTKHNVSGKIYYIVYAHLSESPLLSEWVPIQQGDEIGTAGDTGNMPKCSKPCIHLHLEVATSWPPQGAKIDLYDIYKTREYYPGGESFQECGPNYLWTTCPPNYYPVADAGIGPKFASSGDLVLFNASNSSDPDGTIISYEWDFGDNETATGPIVTHRFRGHADGLKTYWVTLTVEDDKGATDTDTVHVVVEPLNKSVSFDIGVATGVMDVTYNWVNNTNGEDTFIISKIFTYSIGIVGIHQVSITRNLDQLWSDVLLILGSRYETYVSPFTPISIFGVKPYITKLTFAEGVFEGIEIYNSDKMNLLVLGATSIKVYQGDSVSIAFDQNATVEHPLDPYLYMPIGEALMALLKSPGELRIYDSLGRVTGLVDGEIKEEIPNSAYSNNTIVILSSNDSYTYEVVGTDNDTYGLTIVSVKNGNATNFTATDIPIINNSIHQYLIDWGSLSQGEDGVTLQVDTNGDGEFEKTINADNNLTQNEYLDPDNDGVLDPDDNCPFIFGCSKYDGCAEKVYWLPPLSLSSFSIQAGSTLPIKFNVTSCNGDFLEDKSVMTHVFNKENTSINKTYVYGDGSKNIRINATEGIYITNFHTKGYPEGNYTINVVLTNIAANIDIELNKLSSETKGKAIGKNK